VPAPDGFPISTGPDEDITPALTYDGHRVLATWARLSPGRFSIRGKFSSSHGTPSVNGKYFLAYGAAPVVDEPPFQVILGTRVKKNGTRVDDPAIRISHSPSVEGTAPAPVAR
jgi:hypothetical protein